MEKKETHEVVVVIPGSEFHQDSNEHQGLLPSRPPQDVAKLSSSTLTRRIVKKSSFSKPKSRFEEPTYKTIVEVKSQVKNGSTSSFRTSPMASAENTDAKATNPNNNLKSSVLTPPAPLIKLGSGEDNDEEDDGLYDTANLKILETSGKKLSKFVLLEWIAFLCIMAVLIASLTVDRMREAHIWGTKLWRWCVLVLVIFCGRLVAECLIDSLVFMIEQNFLLKQKVLYFVFGLKKAVQAFIWIAMVLLAWGLLISWGGPKRSKHTTRVLNRITRGLAACLVGAALWFIKTLLIKLLASNFQCQRFFDRIQDSLYHQYIVRILSGSPTMEMAQKVGTKSSIDNSGRLGFSKAKKDGSQEDVINFNVEKLQNVNSSKVSFWTMKALADVIGGSSLSTLSGVLDCYDDGNDEDAKNQEIKSKLEAKVAAYRIFINVAKPNTEYIDEDDLLRFVKEQEIDRVMSLFEGAAEKKQIERSVFKKWLIKVYQERRSLALSLGDAKTAIEELNRLVSGILVIVIIVVWLLVTGFLDTKLLVFLSSQLLVAVFVFGNTAKTIFEAIIFVFVMHPYDVGDRCVIDGVQMIVEEVNLLTTIFLRYDSEKIFYPNSVLATKPISNFYRSPEMGDSVEFAVDFSTPAESIAALKSQIKSYIIGKFEYWRSGHSVVVKEIEDVSKLKLGLYVTHTINFQDSGERSKRRSDLVLKLKEILEGLKIKYHLLPQEVVISNADSPAASAR